MNKLEIEQLLIIAIEITFKAKTIYSINELQ